jgi:hypothetical protein
MHRRFPPKSILDIMNKKYEKAQSIVRLGEMGKCPKKRKPLYTLDKRQTSVVRKESHHVMT